MSNNFEIKDLGEADVILNIKLLREEGNGGVTLVQSHYVEKVLNRFGYDDRVAAPTPYDPSVILRKKSENCKRPIKIFTDNWFSHVFG